LIDKNFDHHHYRTSTFIGYDTIDAGGQFKCLRHHWFKQWCKQFEWRPVIGQDRMVSFSSGRAEECYVSGAVAEEGVSEGGALPFVSQLL
jgi:hypothetical protein